MLQISAAKASASRSESRFSVMRFELEDCCWCLTIFVDMAYAHGLRCLYVLSWPCFISTASKFVDENILPVLHSTEYVQRDGKHFGLVSVIRDSGNFPVQFGSLDNFTWNKRRTTESSNLMRLI